MSDELRVTLKEACELVAELELVTGNEIITSGRAQDDASLANTKVAPNKQMLVSGSEVWAFSQHVQGFNSRIREVNQFSFEAGNLNVESVQDYHCEEATLLDVKGIGDIYETSGLTAFYHFPTTSDVKASVGFISIPTDIPVNYKVAYDIIAKAGVVATAYPSNLLLIIGSILGFDNEAQNFVMNGSYRPFGRGSVRASLVNLGPIGQVYCNPSDRFMMKHLVDYVLEPNNTGNIPQMSEGLDAYLTANSELNDISLTGAMTLLSCNFQEAYRIFCLLAEQEYYQIGYTMRGEEGADYYLRSTQPGRNMLI